MVSSPFTSLISLKYLLSNTKSLFSVFVVFLLDVSSDCFVSAAVFVSLWLSPPEMVFTADQFYNEDSQIEKLARYGVLGVEMETTALYTLAAKYGKKALSILTVSFSR